MSIAESYDFDIKKEREIIKQEALDNLRYQQEMQIATQKAQNNMAQQVQLEAQQAAGGVQYDQQRIIGEADSIVQQVMALDPGTRRSRLHQLQVEDLVMYAVVVQRLEQQQTNAAQQAKTQTGGV
jgi:hypothetical protein